ncbi:MAG: putative glycoside hydrolase [Oscillospiraceae bacterium]|jgi:hypothetical protein|nr:putative glycoside hydrolase [Oscillospiraceae bacterium]
MRKKMRPVKLPKPPRRKRGAGRQTASGDFRDPVIGVRSRSVRVLRRFARYGLRALLLFLLVAVGFTAAETLLQISEMPPSAPSIVNGQTTTQALTQTQTVAAPQAASAPLLRALYAPLRMLDSRERTGRVIRQAEESDCNAAVILFKDKEGYLTYESTLPQMDILRASRKARSQVQACLEDYKAAGVETIALLHCFRDPLAAGLMMDGAILQSDSTKPMPWSDALGQRWLNPYTDAAQGYLLSLIAEIAAMGVDNILLDSVSFPAGNLQAANLAADGEADAPAARNRCLREFLAKAKLAANGARLLVLLPAEAALDGGEEYGGDLWNTAADAIAVDTRGADWALDAGWNAGKPTVQIFETLGEAAGQERFLIVEEEAQGS